MSDRWQQLFEAVKYINENFGADIIYDLKRLKGLLMDLAPDCAKEMNALLNILSEQSIIKSLTVGGQIDEGKIAEYIGDNFGFGAVWSSNLSKAAAFLAEKTVTEKTEEKTGKEKKIKVTVKEAPAVVSVPAVEEESKEEKAEPRKGSILSDEWILSRADVMFQKLIGHDEQAASYIDEVSSLIKEDTILSSVVSSIRKNYKDIYGIFESDFYLPGAMTAFLRKYSGNNGRPEYDGLYQRYCDYMNSILEKSITLPPSPKDIPEFPISYIDPVHRDKLIYLVSVDDIKRMEKEAEKYPEVLKRNKRLIDSWCNPFHLFGMKDGELGVVAQECEPKSVYGRYLFLAEQSPKDLLWYCLKKAVEISADSNEELNRFMDKFSERHFNPFSMDDAWMELIKIFPYNEDIHLRLIRLVAYRLDKSWWDQSSYDRLLERKNFYKADEDINRYREFIDLDFKRIEKIIDEKPESMRQVLHAEYEIQKQRALKIYNERFGYVEKRKKEYYEEREKTWMKNKLCRHCGGNFKGTFKKICSRCGREKDYK